MSVDTLGIQILQAGLATGATSFQSNKINHLLKFTGRYDGFDEGNGFGKWARIQQHLCFLRHQGILILKLVDWIEVRALVIDHVTVLFTSFLLKPLNKPKMFIFSSSLKRLTFHLLLCWISQELQAQSCFQSFLYQVYSRFFSQLYFPFASWFVYVSIFFGTFWTQFCLPHSLLFLALIFHFLPLLLGQFENPFWNQGRVPLWDEAERGPGLHNWKPWMEE